MKRMYLSNDDEADLKMNGGNQPPKNLSTKHTKRIFALIAA